MKGTYETEEIKFLFLEFILEINSRNVNIIKGKIEGESSYLHRSIPFKSVAPNYNFAGVSMQDFK